MHSSVPSLFLFFLCFVYGTAVLTVSTRDACGPKSCSRHGPRVQFPFWLDSYQPADCGFHPDFKLSCRDGKTLLSLPHVQESLFVKSINYANRSVLVQDPKKCLPLLLGNLSLSRFSFQRVNDNPYGSFSNNYTLFKCPLPVRTSMTRLGCLTQAGSFEVYAVESNSYVGDLPLVSCERNGSIDLLPQSIDNMMGECPLVWDELDCSNCTSHQLWCRGYASGIKCIAPDNGHNGIALILVEDACVYQF